jgi:CheY-like chemotaxis protein
MHLDHRVCEITLPQGQDAHRKEVMTSLCLIAEDDPFIGNLLLRFAEESGLRGARARTGQEVLALVRRLKPDILILEPELPGVMRGWEAIQALQRGGETDHMAVISCSWLDQAESCKLIGAVTGHLQKPDLHYADFAETMAAAAVATENRAEGEPDCPALSLCDERATMQNVQDAATWWDIELESKPDFNMAMKRIYAWYTQQVLDRPPVRFTRHNAEYESADNIWKPEWQGLKDKWFDVDYQIERFLTQVQGKRYHGETFPIFWPNLGPSVFSAFYGCPLEFGEVTAWAQPILQDYTYPPVLDRQHELLRKLEELTLAALEVCEGKFLVGYSDFHPGLDWLAAIRGAEPLMLDMIDAPQGPASLLCQVTADFFEVYDHFDAMLKARRQPSVTWMAIPSFGKMHIPSCDFASMISPRQFREFAVPALAEEVQHMTHNIFHVDGKGVARHLDAILDLPNLHAIQWVQGVGNDTPIIQWLPLIRRIQAAGKSVVVDLSPAELEDFIGAVQPEGIFLTMASENEEEERAILKRIAQW